MNGDWSNVQLSSNITDDDFVFAASDGDSDPLTTCSD
jgi:hypothetical protein